MDDDESGGVQGDLPYDDWTQDALRQVALRALQYAAAQGLPGEHHFYVTFRTDAPGVDIPARVRAKYPEEMTIVLQHQFWDLVVDTVAERFSVGLSFGGAASKLVIPFAALTAFADPHVRFGLRFKVAEVAPVVVAEPEPEPEPELPPPVEGEAQVVSLDKFRRRKD